MPRRKMLYPVSWLIMIRNYLRETGKRCVSYKGLRKWIYKTATYRDLEWHTVERALRRLAEDGYLERVELAGNRVIFCPKGDIEQTINMMMKSLSNIRGIKV